MKKTRLLFSLLMVPLLFACSPSSDTSGGSGGGGSADESFDPENLTWTVTFDTQGGSAVPAQVVKHEARAEEPLAPTRSGYIFDGWYKDTYAVTPFDFSTKITADWTIYAGWTVDLNPSSSEEPASSSSETPTPSIDAYGPEGSEHVEWYIVGQGANFTGWNAAGGVQLYNDPSDSTIVGCILNMPFAEGDAWKVNDNGSNWLGYEKVTGTAASAFTFVGDGFGGQNISVVTSGNYDIYVSADYSISISVHA